MGYRHLRCPYMLTRLVVKRIKYTHVILLNTIILVNS